MKVLLLSTNYGYEGVCYVLKLTPPQVFDNDFPANFTENLRTRKDLHYLVNLEDALNKMQYDFAANASIYRTYDVVSDGSKSMMKAIKVGSWPYFNDVEETEGSENNSYRNQIYILNKSPGDEHADDFVDDDPAGIVQLEPFLDFLSNNHRGDVKT
jgi:hypothetical protein